MKNESTPEQRRSDMIGIVLLLFWFFVGGLFGIGYGRRRIVRELPYYYVQTVPEFLPIALIITACIGSLIWWLAQNEVAYNPQTSYPQAFLNTLKSGFGICLILAFVITVILPLSALLFPGLYPLW